MTDILAPRECTVADALARLGWGPAAVEHVRFICGGRLPRLVRARFISADDVELTDVDDPGRTIRLVVEL